MVRELFPCDAPVLRQRSRPAGDDITALQDLVLDMFETAKASGGIGLAAPQIGIDQCLIIIDLSGVDQQLKPFALFDPVITSYEGSQTEVEGCLSLPGIEGPVERATTITFTARKIDGTATEMTVDGMLARVIQHEVDHLNGILFIDRFSWPRRLAAYAKLWWLHRRIPASLKKESK